MPKYFMQVDPTEEGGTPTFVEVDETELEIPDTHPTVKALRDAEAAAKRDAIEQRQKYKRLRDAANNDDDDNADEGEGERPTGNTQTPAPQPVDVDALYNDFKRRLQEEQSAEQAKRQSRSARVEAVRTKHKLPKTLDTVLLELADDEAKLENAAKAIASTGFQFDDTPGGSESYGDRPFDPGSVVAGMFKDDN